MQMVEVEEKKRNFPGSFYQSADHSHHYAKYGKQTRKIALCVRRGVKHLVDISGKQRKDENKRPKPFLQKERK